MSEGMQPHRPRRVLVVSQHFWPETFRINDIVEGLLADGTEVDVLCGLPNYPAGEWFPGYRYTGPRRQQYGGAQLFRAGEIRRKNNTGLRIFLNYVSFPLFALFSLPRLHGRRYDAVFCYETSPVLMMLPAILYAKTHKVPLVTYVLDLWPDNLYSVFAVKSPFWRRVAQETSNWFYRRSNRLIAMSDKLAERLAEITAGAKHKPDIVVIPQYCEDFYAEDVRDEALFARFAPPPAAGEEKFFNILFAGNISPAQDLENLVAAMQIVRKNGQNTHIRCLLVGDGMSRDALQNTICEAGLQDAFVFCGTQPATDIPRWTALADALFAGLSKSANLGLTVPAKITSYFAAARPLLVAADGEARRAAEESGAALTSAAGDVAALAQNILTLATLPQAQLTAMGNAGRACYETHYKRSLLLQDLKTAIFKTA